MKKKAGEFTGCSKKILSQTGSSAEVFLPLVCSLSLFSFRDSSAAGTDAHKDEYDGTTTVKGRNSPILVFGVELLCRDPCPPGSGCCRREASADSLFKDQRLINCVASD